MLHNTTFLFQEAVWQFNEQYSLNEPKQWCYLLNHFLPDLSPQYDYYDGQQNDNNGHQTAYQDPGVAVIDFVGWVIHYKKGGLGKKNYSHVLLQTVTMIGRQWWTSYTESKMYEHGFVRKKEYFEHKIFNSLLL